MSRKPDEMLSCIHSRGPTGKMVNVGCFKTEEYACAKHGRCVLNTCPHSRNLVSCKTCMDFAPKNGAKANEFLAKLSEDAKKDYGLEPQVDIISLQELLDDTERTSEIDSGESSGDAGASEINESSDN